MDPYTQAIVVRQIQKEYRAQAATDRLGVLAGRQRVGAPADGPAHRAARLLVTIVLVAWGLGGMVGAATLLGSPMPADGPAPGFAG